MKPSCRAKRCASYKSERTTRRFQGSVVCLAKQDTVERTRPRLTLRATSSQNGHSSLLFPFSLVTIKLTVPASRKDGFKSLLCRKKAQTKRLKRSDDDKSSANKIRVTGHQKQHPPSKENKLLSFCVSRETT